MLLHIGHNNNVIIDKFIPLAVSIVLLIGYQAAYATNESSYNTGYKSGLWGYECFSGDSSCDSPTNSTVYYDCSIGNHNLGSVTNSTACMHGYINGFVDWCGQHPKWCGVVINSHEEPMVKSDVTFSDIANGTHRG